MKKYQETFDSVMSAVNRYVSANGKPQTPEEANAVLKSVIYDLGIATMSWRQALGRTRKSSPTTFALLYNALGVTAPPPPKAPEEPRKRRSEAQDAEPPQVEVEVEPTEDDVLWQVMQWLGKAPAESRRRIVAAAAVFHRLRGAALFLEEGIS